MDNELIMVPWQHIAECTCDWSTTSTWHNHWKAFHIPWSHQAASQQDLGPLTPQQATSCRNSKTSAQYNATRADKIEPIQGSEFR